MSAAEAHRSNNNNGHDHSPSKACPSAWRQADHSLHKPKIYFPIVYLSQKAKNIFPSEKLEKEPGIL